MERLYILKQLDQLYGYVRIDPDVLSQEMYGRNVWYLAHIWVKPRLRGRHYGSMLLDRVCRAADSFNAELVLGVDPPCDGPMGVKALRSFYRRHGFVSSSRNANMMRRKPAKP